MRILVMLVVLALLLLPSLAIAKSQASGDTGPGKAASISAETRQALIDLAHWLVDITLVIEKSQSGGTIIEPDICKDLYGQLLPKCQPEKKPVPILPCP